MPSPTITVPLPPERIARIDELRSKLLLPPSLPEMAAWLIITALDDLDTRAADIRRHQSPEN
jgi:hypothetical protein